MAKSRELDTTGSNNYEPAVHTSSEPCTMCTSVTSPNESWILAGIPVIASGSLFEGLADWSGLENSKRVSKTCYLIICFFILNLTDEDSVIYIYKSQILTD